MNKVKKKYSFTPSARGVVSVHVVALLATTTITRCALRSPRFPDESYTGHYDFKNLDRPLFTLAEHQCTDTLDVVGPTSPIARYKTARGPAMSEGWPSKGHPRVGDNKQRHE